LGERSQEGRWIRYEILKQQEEVIDDIDESVPDIVCGL
jgi:hypothetical protein